MNKSTRRTGLGISLVLFVTALVVSWLTQGTGVVRNDLARNIYIPDELTMTAARHTDQPAAGRVSDSGAGR